MKVQEEMKTAGDQVDSKLAQEVELLKIDLMTARQNLETSTINCKKSSEELDQIKKLNQNLREENEELIKKISGLNEEMDSEKIEAKNTNKKLLEQISLLENDIKLTQNELENCRINQKQFTSKYNEEKEKLKQISNQLISKEKHFEEVMEENGQSYSTSLDLLSIRDIEKESTRSFSDCTTMIR